MKYCLGLILGFAALACVWHLLVVAQIGVPSRSSQWIFDRVRVKTHAAGLEHQPKLLIVGGSSTLYGVSASQIRSESGLPAINFGLHVGLELPVILDLTKKVLKPGDTVLLIFEYWLYKGNFGNEVLADYMYSRDAEFLNAQPLWLTWRMPLYLPMARIASGLESRFLTAGKIIDTASGCVDEFGDETCNLEASRNLDQAAEVQRIFLREKDPPSSTDGFRDIGQFCLWARGERVRVLATYPCTMRSKEYGDPIWRAFFDRVANSYKALDVPVLGTAQTFMYDDPALFFDTPDHLTERGERIRTDELIRLLKPYFPASQIAP